MSCLLLFVRCLCLMFIVVWFGLLCCSLLLCVVSSCAWFVVVRRLLSFAGCSVYVCWSLLFVVFLVVVRCVLIVVDVKGMFMRLLGFVVCCCL